MPITLATPVVVPGTSETTIVVPATQEKTFDEVWLSRVFIHAPMNTASMIVDSTIDMTRTLQSGLKECDPALRRNQITELQYADMTPEELGVMYTLITLISKRAGLSLAEEV